MKGERERKSRTLSQEGIVAQEVTIPFSRISERRMRRGEGGGEKNAPPQIGEHCVAMETALTSEEALCDYS